MTSLKLVEMEQQEALIVEFDDFWAMYPRRVAKADARKAWVKIPKSLHTGILSALFEWRRIWADSTEVQFIPYPATWLRGERWEDEYPEYHRPYRDNPSHVERKSERREEKPMPAHVIAALRKLRGE